MFHPRQFRELVSGRRRGPGAAAARLALGLVEPFYAAAVAWRNRRFDRGAGVVSVNVPVVSVGNLTLGGTGKSPMVRWIAGSLARRGGRPAVVSRGYGASAGMPNDEALEFQLALPDVPHLENPDRVAAARRAIAEFDAAVIVLDDGFQHRRLARNLDLVMLDALEPFGFEHVFPRGTLREPLTGLQRAGVIVLSRADMLAVSERDEIHQRVRQIAPQALWVETAHRAKVLRAADGREEPLDMFHGAPIAAFCGLGNPAGFRHTLEGCGYRVQAFREFPDHHRYGQADLDDLASWVAGANVAAVLCTQKDLVKLKALELGSRPLWALGIELDFLTGQSELEAELEKTGE